MRDVWLAVAVLLALAGIALQAPAPAGVGALILLTAAISRLWSRLSLERVHYERQLEDRRAFVGDSVDVTFTLSNRKPLPVPWIEVRDIVPEQAPPEGVRTGPSPAPGTLLLRRSTSLAWYERVSWRYRFHCKARGYYQFGPAELRSGDIFGFYPQSGSSGVIDRLTVLPRLLDLREIGLPVARPFGETRGGSLLFEDPARIAGVRDYRPGDPLRRIDWKATARRQQLQSRLYDPSSTLSLLVALSIETLAHAWEGYDPLLLERAISVAGSVARYARDRRYAVGLAANCTFPNADRHIWLAPAREPEQLPRILEALAMASPFTLAPLEEILSSARRRVPLGASVVVVAGFLSPGLRNFLVRGANGLERLALVWVGQQPPSELPEHVLVHNAGPYLADFEQRWQAEHGMADPAGAWAER